MRCRPWSISATKQIRASAAVNAASRQAGEEATTETLIRLALKELATVTAPVDLTPESDPDWIAAFLAQYWGRADDCRLR